MPSQTFSLSPVAAFSGLSGEDLALLEARLAPMTIPAGTVLVAEGDAADAMFVVLAGRFSVEIAASPDPVAEIGAGGTIGEIAFFIGGQRTATCRALRDSIVVCLTRADFDDISQRASSVWTHITATLARRLAAETRKSAALAGAPSPRPKPRIVAILPAGPRPVPPHVMAALLAPVHARPETRLVTPGEAAGHGLNIDADPAALAQAFHELERRCAMIMLVADPAHEGWSQAAVRQADEVVLVGYQDSTPRAAPVALNPLEQASLARAHRPPHRLVLLHERRTGLQGTRHWLAQRPVTMHHHATPADQDSLARVWRFVTGEAFGLVACGGGAYCAAHIGLYKAFSERGLGFDMLGGASGGAAMAAAFCEDMPAGEIDARVHRMFIEGRAMARYTLPRYGLLDHAHFDARLRAEYGDGRIEDLWKPYFAVALDLTDYRLEIIRSGPVWAAIRASAAIPGLLPPYITSKGHLLVDGSVASNVPVDVMRQLKGGPNAVVTFDPPAGETVRAAYDSLPARRDLIWRYLNPLTRADLPAIPSAASVLVRSLMANRNHFERHLQASDWLLMPPTPAGMGALDWRRHSELVETAYRYGLAEIDGRAAAGLKPSRA